MSTKIEKRTVSSTTENSTTVSAHASDGKNQNKSFIPSKLVSNSKIKREVVKQQNANQAYPSEILKKVKSKLNKKVVELLSKGDEFQGEKESLKKSPLLSPSSFSMSSSSQPSSDEEKVDSKVDEKVSTNYFKNHNRRHPHPHHHIIQKKN